MVLGQKFTEDPLEIVYVLPCRYPSAAKEAVEQQRAQGGGTANEEDPDVRNQGPEQGDLQLDGSGPARLQSVPGGGQNRKGSC